MGPAARSAWSALAITLVSSAALAAEYSELASHFTKKTPAHALAVLTSYSKTCREGCQYTAPNVKKIERVAYGNSDAAWYTWTWVGNAVKDMKYFSRVTKRTESDGTIALTIRLVKDSTTIAELEKATGKPHNSELDDAKTVITLRPQADGATKITQDMHVSAGVLLSLFSGQIKDGMKASAVANFANIDK
jgi:hypothetical protein